MEGVLFIIKYYVSTTGIDPLFDKLDILFILFYVKPSMMLYCLLYFLKSGFGGRWDPVFFDAKWSID
jgi:hypothetical protein